MDELDDLMTVPEAARLIYHAEGTVYHWIETGKLGAAEGLVRIGRKVLISRPLLLAWKVQRG